MSGYSGFVYDKNGRVESVGKTVLKGPIVSCPFPLLLHIENPKLCYFPLNENLNVTVTFCETVRPWARSQTFCSQVHPDPGP